MSSVQDRKTDNYGFKICAFRTRGNPESETEHKMVWKTEK